MANVPLILLAVMIAHHKIDASIRTVPLQRQFSNTQVTSSGLIQVKSVRSVLECAMTCTGYSKCQAFNYQKGPQLTKCHMFQSQFFEMKDGNLIPNSDYDYYEVNDCHIKRPCHNGGTCIKPVNSKAGIYCHCRHRFTGQFCETLITSTTSTTMVSNTSSPSTTLIPTTSITSTTFTFTPDTSTTSAATLITTESITPSATSTSVETTTDPIKRQTETTMITKAAATVPETTTADVTVLETTKAALTVPTTTVKSAVTVPTTTVKSAVTVTTTTVKATATVPTATRAAVTIPTTMTAPTVASTKTVASTSTATATTQRPTAAIVTATTTQSKAVNVATTTATLNTATKQLSGTNTATTAGETCNRTTVTFTNSTETFCSDNYPETYLKNLECFWLINVTSTSNITIDFNAVELEYSANCSRDRLVIYDGATVKDEILETVCGNVTNHTITTRRHMALVQFITGSRVEFSGFNITYSEKAEVVPISKSSSYSQRLSG